MQNLLEPLFAVTKRKTAYSFVSAIVVAVFSTWAIFDATKAEVTVVNDGDVQVVKTHSTTVGEVLEEVGIEVGKYDELSHDINEKVVDGMNIEYKKANEVTVTIDGKSTDFYTTALTVGTFLSEQSIEVTEHDRISHDEKTLITDGLQIEIEKAFPVVIQTGDEEKKVWSTKQTVEDILRKHDISFDPEVDKIKPALNEVITEETMIDVTKVTTETVEETESIPFQEVKKEDSSLPKGEQKVITEGKEGTVIKKYKVTKENGKEVDRELIDEIVKEESVDKVIAVGTKEVKQESNKKQSASSSSTNAKNSQKSKQSNSGNGKVLTVQATAYVANCAGCSGVTATGINVKNNPSAKVISVDPSVIPLGSRVWVEGYGEAIAGDTGGAIKGNRIDLLVPTEADARKWGIRTVRVKILN